MKSSDALKLSFIKIIRNKHNKILMILLFIFSFLNLVSLMFYKNFTNYIDNIVTNNIGFRSILVSLNFEKEDYGMEDVKKIKHIIDVYSSKYSYASVKSSFESEKYDGYLMLNYGDKNIIPKVLFGNELSADDSNVAICPIEFYPSSEAYNLFIDEKKLISGKKILNEEFTVKYYSYNFDGYRFIEDKEFQKKFKIIGLYDATEESIPSNTCFISGKDVKEIIDVEKSSDSTSAYGFVAVVDKKNNVDGVLKELIDAGFTGSSVQMQLDTSLTNKIALANKLISIFLIICNIFLSFIYIKKKFLSEERLQGILMSEGYSRNSIQKIYLFEISLLSLFSLIISSLLFNILYYSLKLTIFKSLSYSGFLVYNFMIPYIMSFITIFIFPIMIALLLIKVLYKKNVITLIREGD